MEPAIVPIILSYTTLAEVTMFDIKDEFNFENERMCENFRRRNRKLLLPKKYISSNERLNREWAEHYIEDIMFCQNMSSFMENLNSKPIWTNPAVYRLAHRVERLIKDLRKLFPLNIHMMIQKMTIKSPELPGLAVMYCMGLFEQIGNLEVKHVSFKVDSSWYRRRLNSAVLNIELIFPFDINFQVTNAMLKILNSVLFGGYMYMHEYEQCGGSLKLSLTY
jgi:hypothetical protein